MSTPPNSRVVSILKSCRREGILTVSIHEGNGSFPCPFPLLLFHPSFHLSFIHHTSSCMITFSQSCWRVSPSLSLNTMMVCVIKLPSSILLFTFPSFPSYFLWSCHSFHRTPSIFSSPCSFLLLHFHPSFSYEISYPFSPHIRAGVRSFAVSAIYKRELGADEWLARGW